MRMLIIAASAFFLAGAAFAQANNPVVGQSPVGAVTCRIGNVAVFGNRVHVRCSALGQTADAVAVGMANALHGVSQQGATQGSLPTYYYAVGLQSDPALANLTVSLATAAAAQNKQVQIMFNTGTSGNPPGCQPNDCRRLIGLMLLVTN